ncbi:MAG: hypothetical protein WCH91_03070 [bacterium]|jgi:hypothetical protein
MTSGEDDAVVDPPDVAKASPGVVPDAVIAEIARLTTLVPPDEAAVILAAIAHRAGNELHRLARTQANVHRGTPAWGPWAALANTARDAVLKMAALRRGAADAVRPAG